MDSLLQKKIKFIISINLLSLYVLNDGLAN